MTNETYTDEYIAGVLARVRTFAFVGASSNSVRPSYFAMKYLLGKGYNVVPINPGLAGQEILRQKVYASLSECDVQVDVVDIFRNAAAADGIVDEAIAHKERLGATVIWMQLGVVNPGAAERARAAGFDVVMNRCPKIEYGRLSGEIGWMGVSTGILTSRRPKLAPHGVQKAILPDDGSS